MVTRRSLKHSKIREARALYDMRAILGMTDSRKVIVCPLPMHPHHNNTPSFSIYYDSGVQKFACHGACGQKGDVIDLVGFLNIPGYDFNNAEHINRALAILETGYKTSPPQKERKAPALRNNVYEDFLPPGAEVIEYAARRGLTPETLQTLAFGQTYMFGKTWMTMPTFHMGRLMGVKMRNLNPDGYRDRYTSLSGSIAGLFNANDVYYTTDPVLIVKAEIPAALLKQYGFKACAPTGGEGSNEAELYNYMLWSRKRVVVADNDPDPEVRAKIEVFLQKRAKVFRAIVKRPPENYKDIDQYLLAEPEKALAEIRSWLE